MSYFESEAHSSYALHGGDIRKTLQLIADRYMAEQPRRPFVFRASSKDSFIRSRDFRYEMNMDEKFPELQEGKIVYAWAKCWSEQPVEWAFSLSCFGPVRLYVNGEEVFRSNIEQEVFPDRRSWFRLKLKQGWNHFVLRFVKTGTGCGARFGTGSIKGLPLHFILPSVERSGGEGWLYTLPLEHDIGVLPSEGIAEGQTGLQWLPASQWTEAELGMGVFERLYGRRAEREELADRSSGERRDEVAFAWTWLSSELEFDQTVTVKGKYKGSITVWLDGLVVYDNEVPDEGANLQTSDTFSFEESNGLKARSLVIRSLGGADGWDIQFDPLPQGLEFSIPHEVQGAAGQWLYLGSFPSSYKPDIADITVMNTVFGRSEGKVYWMVDQPGAAVRPYAENTHYGRWNYPLGVTLYGLLKTGKELGRTDYTEYVLEHIEQCTSYDRYALWDHSIHGAAGINHQLTTIDSLDDCGSFGATMLYAMEQRELAGGREAADRIAHYISHIQDRLENGALYRVRGSTDFMQQTVWCDDLYMSTPFLCRYYELTGDTAYLDDAAEQFIHYKELLYMPDRQLMSHVYDFKFDKQTGVPWGRGNGWVLFSLTELLVLLPPEHSRYAELIDFFRELSDGYVKHQGIHGLWHQVLDDPESYEEASCTSMFIYAYARGVRYGWLTESEPYMAAVAKGWEGLTKHAIDREGNIYGVCRGSGYSYSPLYYKDDLSWNLNDTHGIGIVMLAGVETLLLELWNQGRAIH